MEFRTEHALLIWIFGKGEYLWKVAENRFQEAIPTKCDRYGSLEETSENRHVVAHFKLH